MNTMTGDIYEDRSKALLAGVNEKNLLEFANEILTPIQRATMKIGRNDPCPCGSGKRFKKCHLGKTLEDVKK